MDKKCFKMQSFWFTVVKLCLGIICYALFCYYYNVRLLFCTNLDLYETRQCLVRYEVAVTACVGFTFVIEPAIIAAYIATPEHYEKTILSQAFSLAGMITYFAGGSMIIYFDNQGLLSYRPFRATGSMFLVTGLFYAAHLSNSIRQRRNS